MVNIQSEFNIRENKEIVGNLLVIWYIMPLPNICTFKKNHGRYYNRRRKR